MKYENRKIFRHIIIGLLEKSGIMRSPIREKFISLSWRIYNSPNGNIKIYANKFEKNRYEDIIKKIKQHRAWGNYLYLITNGNPTRLL